MQLLNVVQVLGFIPLTQTDNMSRLHNIAVRHALQLVESYRLFVQLRHAQSLAPFCCYNMQYVDPIGKAAVYAKYEQEQYLFPYHLF